MRSVLLRRNLQHRVVGRASMLLLHRASGATSANGSLVVQDVTLGLQGCRNGYRAFQPRYGDLPRD
jgi:hypothetical protein